MFLPDHDSKVLDLEQARAYAQALAARCGVPAADREDVAQDAIGLLLEREPELGLAEWRKMMFRCVRAAVRQHRRYGQRHVPLPDIAIVPADDPRSSIEDAIDRDREAELLRRALRDLPENERDVIRLYSEGVSADDVAAARGHSRGTFYYRLNKAFRLLRKRIRPKTRNQ